jgi:hypothetical protein
MQGPLFPFGIANAYDAFVQILEPISRDDVCGKTHTRRASEHDGCTTMMASTFGQVKSGSGMSENLRRAGALLRRFGKAWMRGLHEQRRREAARIIAHEHYLAALDRAARLGADARPRIARVHRAPATQPAQDCGTI